MSDNGFKVWMAFCTVLGLAFFGLLAWAIVRLVVHFT